MSVIWGQANAYSKFMMLMFLVYPTCMLILAWKIEKLYKDYDEMEKGQSAATEKAH